MQWPVSRKGYADPVFLDRAQDAIARISNAISKFEPVTVPVANSDHSTHPTPALPKKCQTASPPQLLPARPIAAI